MSCTNCNQENGHTEWCYYHPDKEAARTAARAEVAHWIDTSTVQRDAATVWQFYKAPQCMRSWDLSSQDDADWIAIFPPDYPSAWWADSGTPFGCFDVDNIELPNGWTMRVGFHS